MIRLDWPTSPFWDHSLALYARPEVEAACLELQHRHGLDVNLVLLCCWLGARGVTLDRAALERLQALSRGWQRDVVRPLRTIRQGLKVALARGEPADICGRLPDLATALRARVLEVELDGEHIEQLALEGAVADLPAAAPPGPGLAARNLRCYRRFREPDRSALAALLRAAFPQAGADEIGAALRLSLAARPPAR